jgi:hypothetical protein
MTQDCCCLLPIVDVAQVKKVYLLARGKKQLTAAQRVDKVRRSGRQQQQQQAVCLANALNPLGMLIAPRVYSSYYRSWCTARVALEA